MKTLKKKKFTTQWLPQKTQPTHIDLRQSRAHLTTESRISNNLAQSRRITKHNSAHRIYAAPLWQHGISLSLARTRSLTLACAQLARLGGARLARLGGAQLVRLVRLDTRLDTRLDARLDARLDVRLDARLDARLDEQLRGVEWRCR